MAEWFKRGTVNTFYRGSNPLKAYKIIFNIVYCLSHKYALVFNLINYTLLRSTKKIIKIIKKKYKNIPLKIQARTPKARAKKKKRKIFYLNFKLKV
jgi:hypothetical protein